MGGCCCCSSRGSGISNTTAYYYYPRATEERVPLSSHRRGSSALSTGLLVDTNLETATPDAYTAPPAPIPFDVPLGRPQTLHSPQDVCADKRDGVPEIVNTGTPPVTIADVAADTSPGCEDKKADLKAQTELDVKELESEIVKPALLEIEECPICLEEYDEENPKLTASCEHHFHLACILEWMERSETCPVCGQEIMLDPPIV